MKYDQGWLIPGYTMGDTMGDTIGYTMGYTMDRFMDYTMKCNQWHSNQCGHLLPVGAVHWSAKLFYHNCTGIEPSRSQRRDRERGCYVTTIASYINKSC